MKPTAIQVAEDLYYKFHSAEELFINDPDQAVFTLKDVIYILQKYDVPAPDFNIWASALTDKAIKPNAKIKHRISNKIKEAMAKKQINNTQLAELLGRPRSFMTRVMAGGNLTLNTIIRIEQVLGVKLLDLE